MHTYHRSILGFAATVGLLGLTIAGCPKQQPGGDGGGAGVAAGTQLTILYASNNDGEIEPCG